jgi:1-aminocyclopropane-1-carboxylate deaminase
MAFDTSLSIIQKIDHPELLDRNCQLYIKRDDLIHADVSGNKWRKLKYNIAQFRISKKEHLLTFGGAFSNHLLATASACHQHGIQSIGVVRGEELTAYSNPVLQRCSKLGMKLHFVSREEYGMRYDKEYLEELSIEFPNSFIIPEGGANYFGMIGCQEILNEINVEIDHVFVAQGTSTTSCGILLNNQLKHLHVVPALKGYHSLEEMSALYAKSGFEKELIDQLLEKVIVHDDSHFGGYAKSSTELEEFIAKCNTEMNLPLDKVYTGKAFFALLAAVNRGELDNQKVLFVHTGGLYLNQE